MARKGALPNTVLEPGGQDAPGRPAPRAGNAGRAPSGHGAKVVAAFRRHASLLRVAVSVGLIYLVLQRTSLTEIGGLLRQTVDHWPLLAIGTLLPVLGTLFAALRWRVLLGGLGARARVHSLYRAVLVGSFFNYFLPSTIGGDVARSWWIQRTLGSTTLSLTVVALDRFIGLIGICAVGLVAAAFQPSLVRELPQFWIVAGVVGLSCMLVASLWHPAAAATGRRVFSLPLLNAFREKVARAYCGLVSLRGAKPRFAAAFLMSAGLQILIILQYFAFATALEAGISLSELAVLIPIVILITALPFTINGIGLREASLAVLGARFGLGAEDAIAMAWLFLCVHFVYALIGGVIYMLGRSRAE